MVLQSDNIYKPYPCVAIQQFRTAIQQRSRYLEPTYNIVIIMKKKNIEYNTKERPLQWNVLLKQVDQKKGRPTNRS